MSACMMDDSPWCSPGTCKVCDEQRLSPDERRMRKHVKMLRPKVDRKVIHEYTAGCDWLHCRISGQAFSNRSEWIEYIPPVEQRIQGKKLVPICKRCGGSRTIDRGPPAGDGPCPDCREPFGECPTCGCLDGRAAGCGCACHGQSRSHF